MSKYFKGTPEMGPQDNAGDVFVVIEEDERALDLRLDLYNHSPTGFAWNYLGSGPAQLALAILAYVKNDEWALDHYHEFKHEVISMIAPGEWQLEYGFVADWIKRVMAREGHRPLKNRGDQQ